MVNEYDANNRSYLTGIKDAASGKYIWRGSFANARGQFTQYVSGSGAGAMQVAMSYDKYGFPTRTLSGNIMDYRLAFNQKNGNLNTRGDHSLGRSLTEDFTAHYDDQDRLTYKITT